MKLFISWSGIRSKGLAEALRDWLPMLFETVEPWVSANDIEAGQRWSSEIASELEQTNFGIVCVTPENKEAPWIHFEAGALAKTIDKARVVPLLLGMPMSDLPGTGPLAQFQAKPVSKEGIKDIVVAINGLSAKPRKEELINELFEQLWTILESRIADLTAAPEISQQKHRPMEQVLEELVTVIQRLNGKISTLSAPKFGGFRDALLESVLEQPAKDALLHRPSNVSLGDILGIALNEKTRTADSIIKSKRITGSERDNDEYEG